MGQVGGEWRTRYDLAESILLPGIRDVISPTPFYDPLPTIVETRFPSPLEGFGLGEVQEPDRAPGELEPGRAYRKTPLFDRFVGFALPRG